MLKWRTPTKTSRTCCHPRVRSLQQGWPEPDLKVLLEPPHLLVVQEVQEVPTLLATIMDLVVLLGLDTMAAPEVHLQTGMDQVVLEVPGVPEVLGDLEDRGDLGDLHRIAGTGPATVGVLEDQASILHPPTATRPLEVR